MKAPDKIYIPIIEEEGKRLLCTNWWETDTSSRNAYVNETIPYIRKDALLEWAEKKKNDVKKFGQRYNEANYYNSGCHDTIQELIDKINSL